jgi:hypothetical protein
VDNTIGVECHHLTPVIDNESFIKQYKALTRILEQCGEVAFGHIKRGKKSTQRKMTSPNIQCIQAHIKSLGGLRMTNPGQPSEVWYTS